MENEVKNAVEHLKKGHVILYPTDTIWGIGCDATREDIVDKVYKIKKRMMEKSLIVLLASEEELEKYVRVVPKIAYDLISSIDKPLTIIYPNAINLAPNVVASDNSIAIRVVKHDFCKEMIRRFGKPVVSTSANISGDPSPVVYSRISDEIIKAVDHVVNYHRNMIHQTRPSTIIKINEKGIFHIIRE
jgi:L-threonylcarbamoyladenylate synthase